MNIGIDIGGTKTSVAAVDLAGQIIARTSFPTRSERGVNTCLAELSDAIRSVLRQANIETISGIGIGCAGPVNPLRGTIHNPFTLPGWEGMDIVRPLKEAFSLPVRLENDADAAAVGEYFFGAGRGANPLVMVTLGTGVGGAVLLNGQIYRGVNGEHPELGHLAVMIGDGPDCYCGRRGCWESFASGTAIGEAGKALGFADSRAVFGSSGRNADASAIIERAVKATSAAAWTLIHTFLPQRIILGGGIGEEHFEVFAPFLRKTASDATQVPKGAVEIVKAQLGNDAGVIGAACLVWQPHSI